VVPVTRADRADIVASMAESAPQPERELRSDVADVQLWALVAEDRDLLEAAGRVDPTDVRAVERLRRSYPIEVVATALELVGARALARMKFPDAARLVCDRAAVQQASSAAVAAWKAAAIAERCPASAVLVDCCSGMGGDCMAFVAARGAPVTLAVDQSPLRAWMTERNAGCIARAADVRRVADLVAERGLGVAETVVHIDPARRDESSGRRRIDPAQHEPPLEVCVGLASAALGGVVKLGPGIDRTDLPESARDAASIEWICEDGRLVQALVAFGCCRDRREARATSIERGPDGSARAVHTMSGTPNQPPIADGPIRGVLVTLDPALERSGLHGVFAAEHDLAEPARGLGLLVPRDDRSANELAEQVGPWARCRTIRCEVRADERSVADALRSEFVGCPLREVRVRTRAAAVDADRWTIDLARRVGADPRATNGVVAEVYVLRIGDRLRAFIVDEASPVRG
jgi:hypothetical protein